MSDYTVNFMYFYINNIAQATEFNHSSSPPQKEKSIIESIQLIEYFNIM